MTEEERRGNAGQDAWPRNESPKSEAQNQWDGNRELYPKNAAFCGKGLRAKRQSHSEPGSKTGGRRGYHLGGLNLGRMRVCRPG